MGNRACWFVPVLPLLWACMTAAAHEADHLAVSREGMVATDSADASRAGAQILRAGGNAFDAAIAVSLALSVTRPESTGLGGGGFLLAYVAAEQRFAALDFRESAPAAATPQRYAELRAAAPDGPSPSLYGGNAVGVPGLVAGLEEIHRRWATRPLAELARPAIELAQRGLVVDAHYLHSFEGAIRDFDRWPDFRERFAGLHATLLCGGEPPAIGERIARPHLAGALQFLAEHGLRSFYEGPIAEAVVAAVRQAGGELTAEDLRSYRVAERTPVRGRFGQYEIVSMPPPSSGGVCLIEALQIVAAARLRSDLDPVATAPHVLVEAFKHAFADRARWLGDPDYCEVPLAQLTSQRYAAELAARIDPQATQPPQHYGTGTVQVDDAGTSHFCVADRHGNIVAMTETINTKFGSYVVAEPYGIVLNNQLDDFLTAPGTANVYGLVQSQANLIGPGKRPLSSMTPAIVLCEGRPVLALGASGGPRIITAVAQVLLAVIDGATLHDAISAPRLHHQWRPNEVYFDREPTRALRDKLIRCGHSISAARRTASVQAIQFLADGVMVGASDPNKGGRPAAP